MQCTTCGHDHPAGANYCARCGAAVAAATVDPNATVVVPTPIAAPPEATHYAPPPPPRRGPGSALAVKAALAVVTVLLLIAAGLLLLVMLSNEDRALPSAAALDEPTARLVTTPSGTAVEVPVDLDGSVDNIALYANGQLVDQATSLGGTLVWTNPPDGTHDLVLRAQLGADVLIGAAATIVVGPTDETSDTPATSTDPSTAAPSSTSAPPSTSAASTTTTTAPTTTTADPGAAPGPYVAVLASLPKASTTAEQAEASGATLAIRFGATGHRVIDSDRWASLRDGFWVVATPEDFDTIEAAAAHCWQLGARDTSTCFGRPVTQDPGDLTRVAPPAP